MGDLDRSKSGIKNQSGTADAGGYELNLMPPVNASTCAYSCVHVHNIPMKEGKKIKFQGVVGRACSNHSHQNFTLALLEKKERHQGGSLKARISGLLQLSSGNYFPC